MGGAGIATDAIRSGSLLIHRGIKMVKWEQEVCGWISLGVQCFEALGRSSESAL